MSNTLSVYRQLINTPENLFEVLKREIGLKTDCIPFAVKAISNLKLLGNLTEAEAVNAANVFLANLQTLNQGGIKAEDYDKIDFVKRGKSITISARVEAFYRAAARKGYRITDTIVAVPKEDSDTTYFREEFYNGEIVYVLEDRRINPDRKITAERIANNYFSKFICRLTVINTKDGTRFMSECEMSAEEMLEISNTGEQGIYKTKWVEYARTNGTVGKRKVVTEELNTDSFWCKWTGEMAKKTIIRRALKRVKEVLPELKDTIYAFDKEEEFEPPESFLPPEKIEFEIPMEAVKVDITNLTAEQKEDIKETLDLFKVNPKLAVDKANEIKALLEGGAELQEVINTHYASIVNIARSKNTFPIIEPWFGKLLKGGKSNE